MRHLFHTVFHTAFLATLVIGLFVDINQSEAGEQRPLAKRLPLKFDPSVLGRIEKINSTQKLKLEKTARIPLIPTVVVAADSGDLWLVMGPACYYVTIDPNDEIDEGSGESNNTHIFLWLQTDNLMTPEVIETPPGFYYYEGEITEQGFCPLTPP